MIGTTPTRPNELHCIGTTLLDLQNWRSIIFKAQSQQGYLKCSAANHKRDGRALNLGIDTRLERQGNRGATTRRNVTRGWRNGFDPIS